MLHLFKKGPSRFGSKYKSFSFRQLAIGGSYLKVPGFSVFKPSQELDYIKRVLELRKKRPAPRYNRRY